MIDEEKTLEQFGYTSDSLSYGSAKKVIAICDKCGKERIIRFQQYRGLCIFCVQIGKHSGENNPMYGKHHSDETKKKISKNSAHLSGKNSSMYGVHRFGKDNPMYGKHHSEETKQKISKSQRGEMGPNWRGGISYLPYCSKFNNNLRENIRKRDNYICQLCGKIQKNRRFSVHHIHYDKENCNPDLITLCTSCNVKVNFKREYWEQYFMRKLCYRKKIVQIYSIENELNIWNYGEF